MFSMTNLYKSIAEVSFASAQDFVHYQAVLKSMFINKLEPDSNSMWTYENDIEETFVFVRRLKVLFHFPDYICQNTFVSASIAFQSDFKLGIQEHSNPSDSAGAASFNASHHRAPEVPRQSHRIDNYAFPLFKIFYTSFIGDCPNFTFKSSIKMERRPAINFSPYPVQRNMNHSLR